MIIFAQKNDTVDAICWRYYGQTQGIVEQVYELNYRLSAQGVFLKHGTKIKLPTEVTKAEVREGFNLWD